MIINYITLLLLFIGLSYAQDISCSNELESYQNGNIEFCILLHKDTLSGQPLSAGTGVHFTEGGVFDWCFLQKDTKIQGYLCRGDGHNFMTSFYPNGQLRIAWLAEDEVIQSIPCSRFRFLSAIFVGIHGKNGETSFYENGQLKYCELSKNTIIEGKVYRKRDAVRFNPEGKLIVTN